MKISERISKRSLEFQAMTDLKIRLEFYKGTNQTQLNSALTG